MKLISLACNNCGAGLEVSDEARFVTCTHCHSQLRIKRTGAAAYTALMGKVAELRQTTDSIAGDVSELKLRQQLNDLDESWKEYCEEVCQRDARGNLLRPKGDPGRVVAFSAVGVGLLVFGAVFSLGLALLGVLFLIFGAITYKRPNPQAEAFERGEAEYEAERADILRELTMLG